MSRLRPSLPWFRLVPVSLGVINSSGNSTDNAIARWDGTGGGLLQNSGVLISDTNAITGALSLTLGTAGVSTGILTLSGSTSGTITIKSANAAGTYTLTLPIDDGNANQVLTTDGSGVLSWTTITSTSALTNAHIFVGDVTNTATDVAMSGDVTITNTGVTTIKTNVALAGSPTTTTQLAGDNSTKIATTAYADAAVAAKTITLTGHVTGSGTGSFATTIAAGVVTEAMQTLADNTTANVTSTAHGYAPKSLSDATQFLNGAATPAYAQVKDSDLSTTDITTNDASTTKHGFVVKATAPAASVLNVVGIANGETAYTNKSIFDATAPSTQAFGDSAAAGTSLIAAHRDHKHAMPIGPNSIADGRLTLTTGVPVTTSDVTGATSIFYTPYKGNRIALYNGSSWIIDTFSEITIALGTLTSGLPYDLFAYDSSGTVTFDSPLAWTNGTTRATALTTQDGVYVKSGATTRRYIGTFYTTSTTQTEDSAAKRYLFNAHNAVKKNLIAVDTTASWTYTTNTLREARGGSTYGVSRVGILRGLDEYAVEVDVYGEATQSGTAGIHVDIGIDNTTGVAQINPNMTATSSRQGAMAKYVGNPSIGNHYLAWLETSQAVGTTTWWGGAALNSDQRGLLGSIYV